MFYYENWEQFCNWIHSIGIKTYTAEQSLSLDLSNNRFIVLKHDVETNVPRALQLAEIEHRNGISGSYYVQAYLLNSEENVRMLREIREMGHEVSYHYDVLDANNGDFVKAESDFDQWLKVFHDKGFEFKTICQHGNPVKNRVGYTSNRDFFRNQDIKKRHNDLVDMVVNYSKYAKSDYIYISDAGYKWKHITEPENNDLRPDSETIIIGGFQKLKEYIQSKDCSVIISTHPHRWESSAFKINSKIQIFRVVRTTVRCLQKFPGINSILNRFYFLAKKI